MAQQDNHEGLEAPKVVFEDDKKVKRKEIDVEDLFDKAEATSLWNSISLINENLENLNRDQLGVAL